MHVTRATINKLSCAHSYIAHVISQCTALSLLVYSACDFVACNESQLVDACASAEPEVALDHRGNRSYYFICSRVGASFVHKNTYTLLNKLRKIITEAMDSINPETVKKLLKESQKLH